MAIIKYKEKALENKLNLILAPNKGSKTVTVLLMVGTGSKYETKKISGISHFLEHMFFKGTKKRPNTLAISEYLDEVGGEYNAFTSKEYTGYYAKLASKNIDRGIDFVSDIMLNSKFEQKEIDRERGVIIEEMNMYQDTPMMYTGDLLERLMYGDTPAGRLVIGYKDQILKMNREDFLRYFESQYVANNMNLVVAGDYDEKKLIKMIESTFGKIKDGSFKKAKKVVEKQSRVGMMLNYKKTDQSHMALGFRGVSIKHKDKYAMNVLGLLLGGGMSSRLFINIRERLGLCYYIRSSAEFFTDHGYLGIRAGVDNKKIDLAISKILEELGRLKEESVSDKEMKKVKDYLQGRTMMGLESSDDVAMWLVMQKVLSGKIVSVEERMKKIREVTAADIKRVARKYLRAENMNFAVIGPYKNKNRFSKLLKI